MALQITIERENIECAARVLRGIWEDIEVFKICERYTGISISNKILDTVGEDTVKESLTQIRHYNLWDGKWRDPEQGACIQPSVA
jgi:hypothetical protein